MVEKQVQKLNQHLYHLIVPYRGQKFFKKSDHTLCKFLFNLIGRLLQDESLCNPTKVYFNIKELT